MPLEAGEKGTGRVAALNLHIGRGSPAPARCAVEDLVAKDSFADVPPLVRQRGGARGVRKVAGDDHTDQEDNNSERLPAPHISFAELVIYPDRRRLLLARSPLV